MEQSRLFEDIRTADEMGKALAVPADAAAPEVAAIERGHREHPDGTTEDYERVEFRG